ncbi:efflux RND transporter periplasmic adaptor subunit [Kushneria phosphatilytica]|uniref:Efflux RND transporter periplasmic adaptor subunit n=2 Tax=Kushneria phosphatilytica TaxID=657387 RepID=A0A5C0ZUG2_9GAMM|nr:efflux RND transporter periplasmic adaptor subunit [Kushneria phosphatilytica]QEL10022.1 efflux RND transporter periplasmic adaptor subunit [Kushneria phosphatilytica]
MNVYPMFRALRLPPLVLATALLGSILLTGCDSQAEEAQQAPPSPEVSVAEVLVQGVRYWDEFTGRIEAVETVELRPRVAGYIERINYTEGQLVKAGDVLFVIDQRPYQAALSRARAELQRAEANARLARIQASRAETLASNRAISREELDQRRAASAQATADVLAARADVTTASLNMEYTEVRAPISGRTGRALITVGNLISDTSLLTTIVSLDQVYVYFYADEQSYLHYDALARSGKRQSSRDEPTPVRVGLASDSGYPYEGRVDFVDNRLDTAAGTILMRAVLDNRDGRFSPGMFARVQLRGGGEQNAILIDDKAVLTDQDRKFVYVVNDQGITVRKDIQPGRKVDDLRVVVSGLAPGDRIVVRGAQRIFFPGAPVSARSVPMREVPSTPQLSSN